MTPPSIRDIRDDNELLDSLGARRHAKGNDEVAGMLASWVEEIDDDGQKAPGRYARVRRSGVRLGAASVLVVAALSASGVAAAMTQTNLPVFHQLGQITHGLVFGTHPIQTAQPTHAVDGTTGTTTAASWGTSTTSTDGASATSVPPALTTSTSAGSTYLRLPPPVVGTSSSTSSASPSRTSTSSTSSSSSSSATSSTSSSTSTSTSTASPTTSVTSTTSTSPPSGPTVAPPTPTMTAPPTRPYGPGPSPAPTPTMTRSTTMSFGPGPSPTSTPPMLSPSTSSTSTTLSTPPPHLPTTR